MTFLAFVLPIALLAIGCTIGAFLSGSYGPEDFETHKRPRLGIDHVSRRHGPRL